MKKSDNKNDITELNNNDMNETDNLSGLYDITKMKVDIDKAMDLESIKVSEALIQSTLNLAKQQEDIKESNNKDNKDNNDEESNNNRSNEYKQETKLNNERDISKPRKRSSLYHYGMIAACIGVIAIAGVCIATGSIPIGGKGSSDQSKNDCTSSLESADNATTTEEATTESADKEATEESITTDTSEDSMTSGGSTNEGADAGESGVSVEGDKNDMRSFFRIKMDIEAIMITLEDIKEIKIYDSEGNTINTISDFRKIEEIYNCLEEIEGDNLLQNGEHKGQYTRRYGIIADDGLSWSELDISIPEKANNETTYQIQRILLTSEGETIMDTVTNVKSSVIERLNTLTDR